MAILNIGELKKVIEHLPDDYEVSYKDAETTQPLTAVVEIDIEGKQLILK